MAPRPPLSRAQPSPQATVPGTTSCSCPDAASIRSEKTVSDFFLLSGHKTDFLANSRKLLRSFTVMQHNDIDESFNLKDRITRGHARSASWTSQESSFSGSSPNTPPLSPSASECASSDDEHLSAELSTPNLPRALAKQEQEGLRDEYAWDEAGVFLAPPIPMPSLPYSAINSSATTSCDSLASFHTVIDGESVPSSRSSTLALPLVASCTGPSVARSTSSYCKRVPVPVYRLDLEEPEVEFRVSTAPAWDMVAHRQPRLSAGQRAQNYAARTSELQIESPDWWLDATTGIHRPISHRRYFTQAVRRVAVHQRESVSRVLPSF